MKSKQPKKPTQYRLQRIEEELARDVERLGVAGNSFGDVLQNLINVIKADKSLSQTVREMGLNNRKGATPPPRLRRR